MKRKKPEPSLKPTLVELILTKNSKLAKHFEYVQELQRSKFTNQVLLFSDPESKIMLTEKLISEIRKRVIDDPVNLWYSLYNLPTQETEEELAKINSVHEFRAKNQLEKLQYDDLQNAIVEITEADASVSEIELNGIIKKASAQIGNPDSLKLLANSDSPTKTMVYLLIQHHFQLKELDFLQEQLKKLRGLPLKDEVIGGNKEFTTARQVLAMHYMLNELGVNENVIDKTQMASFTQFFTGKETGAAKIKDTNIYKWFKKLLSKSDKKLDADLKFIRDYFERLGLESIVNQINREIRSKE